MFVASERLNAQAPGRDPCGCLESKNCLLLSCVTGTWPSERKEIEVRMRTVIDEARAIVSAIGEVDAEASRRMANLFNERLEETRVTCRPSRDVRQIR
jgi:hypothetical protein